MKYLAACCTAKNEEAIILEWMAFHRAAGIEHLIIIDNGSTDRTAQIVKDFKDQSAVTYISWPERSTQVDMYNYVLREYQDAFEWCAFIDADEFLYASDSRDLRLALSSIPSDTGAIGVHWHVYGSSGHTIAPSGLVIENYKHRAIDGSHNDHHVKTIVRLSRAIRAYSSHMFEAKGGAFDDAGNKLHENDPFGLFPDKPVTYQKMRINHYHCRSRAEYMTKIGKGYFGVDDAKLENEEKANAMFAAHDCNDVFDDSATAFSNLVKYYMEPATNR